MEDTNDILTFFKKKVYEDKLVTEQPVKLSNVETPEIAGKPIGREDLPVGSPVEIPEVIVETDTLKMMHANAVENAVNAKTDNYNIAVSENIDELLVNNDRLLYFTIIESDDPENNAYVVYQIGARIYYRRLKEFLQIRMDYEDEVPGVSIASFKNKYDKVREPLDTSYSVTDRDDCKFVICSIFSSITGKSYDNDLIIDREIKESCFIRKHNKLGTDGVFKNSKLCHDAKYGTEEQNSFKQELEDKQKKDGTVGSLDQQQQQESESPVIPNVNRKMMSERVCGIDIDALLEAKVDDIYYEPHDRVVVKTEAGEFPGMVTDVFDSLDNGQIITVLCQGHTIQVTNKEIRPDMNYLANQLLDYTDEFSDLAFHIDAATRLNTKAENDKTDYSKDYSDLNDFGIECNIISNGYQINYEKQFASLRDIAEGNKFIKVVNESGSIDMWPIQSIEIDRGKWPYAVIVNPEDADNEPLRKIKINPKSYVEASDDDLVDCILGTEDTQIVKKNIRIIS